jgi:hypothetical protein
MGTALKLDEMSLADKLQTMETLWDDLCRNAPDVAVPEWHNEVLAVREADFREGREHFTDWETAKRTIRESLK